MGWIHGHIFIIPCRVKAFDFIVTCPKIIYSFNLISNLTCKILSSEKEFQMSITNKKAISWTQ